MVLSRSHSSHRRRKTNLHDWSWAAGCAKNRREAEDPSQRQIRPWHLGWRSDCWPLGVQSGMSLAPPYPPSPLLPLVKRVEYAGAWDVPQSSVIEIMEPYVTLFPQKICQIYRVGSCLHGAFLRTTNDPVDPERTWRNLDRFTILLIDYETCCSTPPLYNVQCGTYLVPGTLCSRYEYEAILINSWCLVLVCVCDDRLHTCCAFPFVWPVWACCTVYVNFTVRKNVSTYVPGTTTFFVSPSHLHIIVLHEVQLRPGVTWRGTSPPSSLRCMCVPSILWRELGFGIFYPRQLAYQFFVFSSIKKNQTNKKTRWVSDSWNRPSLILILLRTRLNYRPPETPVMCVRVCTDKTKSCCIMIAYTTIALAV